MHLLQALRHPHEITVRHTRSHVGDPGNEVADALAKWACHRGGAVDAAVLPDTAAARISFAWLWLPDLPIPSFVGWTFSPTRAPYPS